MTDNKATTDGASNKAPKIDPERAAWFAESGYTGADDEVVTLRNNLGMASAQHVWAVLVGLRALGRDYNGLFQRMANSAHDERRPVDGAKHLSADEFGALTDYTSGDWLSGRRELVVALLDVDADGNAAFAGRPLTPVEVPKAA